ncbi:MAG: ABC transporter substrate-binding protein [Verrucomicrobiae bacterium]|nr:ABC transporter substrate-binding protein [Verrucomicrobiae bacterium]
MRTPSHPFLSGLPALVFAASLTGLPASAQDAPLTPLTSDQVAARIRVGPYEIPDLPLRTNLNYAASAADVEPFGGVKPHKEHFLVQMEYTGPGRAIPEPDEVETVKIGFLGPIEPTVSVATGGGSHNEETLGKMMLKGAQLAIDQANAAGGYRARNIPFELVVRNDNALWGASGNEIIRMAYDDKVWAILGSIDGANTHIAIRVALKAEIPWMTSGDLDPTYIETNIPWVFRCIGDDRQQNYLILDYLFRKHDYRRIAIIRASSRYGRFGVREIRDGCRRLGRPVLVEMAYKGGITDFSMQLDRIAEVDPEVVIHWGNGPDAARILNAMRARGMNQLFIASDRAVSDEFVRIAGPNAEGVLCGYPWNPESASPRLEAFREAFQARYQASPETYAAHAYDGMNLLIWAIQHAGLNRARIRDMLAYRTDAWPGVTGDIPLSAALDDAGEVFLAVREAGHWTFHSREDLGIPRGEVIERMRTERQSAMK